MFVNDFKLEKATKGGDCIFKLPNHVIGESSELAVIAYPVKISQLRKPNNRSWQKQNPILYCYRIGLLSFIHQKNEVHQSL